MISYLIELSAPGMGFVVGILTAIYAFIYARYVLKSSAQESKKVFFKTLAAGLAAAGTIALLLNQAAPAAPAPLAEPFFI